MPTLTKTAVAEFADAVAAWPSRHRGAALRFIDDVGPDTLLLMLHSMRRWYTGQTMIGNLIRLNRHFARVMKLDALPALYRGFKVPRRSELADVEVGDVVTIPVTRNHGLSSWTMRESMADRFSGKSKDRVGVVIQLDKSSRVRAILAPPQRTQAWFNALYEAAIGVSFRPLEGEYVLLAAKVKAKVRRVKR